ncbi:hypothetical protein ACFQZ4_46980 [Catellatospora coxensis]
MGQPAARRTAAAPITYQAALDADGLFEKVTISGAEVIGDWHPHAGQAGRVWVATVPNTLFGSPNPYLERIGGDWFFDQVNTWHTGEVYLDGKSLYESLTMAGVEHPEVTVDSFDQAGSLLTWYCEVGDDVTTIWANFGAPTRRTTRSRSTRASPSSGPPPRALTTSRCAASP